MENKENYRILELEVVCFDNCDIITESDDLPDVGTNA